MSDPALSAAIDYLRRDIASALIEGNGTPGLQVVLPFHIGETLLTALDNGDRLKGHLEVIAARTLCSELPSLEFVHLADMIMLYDRLIKDARVAVKVWG